MHSTRPVLHAAGPGDVEYYRLRTCQEENAAKLATSAQARSRHEELAAIYRTRVAMLCAEAGDESARALVSFEATG
jgi:hypothetical protein